MAQAKAAAARYHDVRKAIADGYHDTVIVLPNMGRHFLKDELVDTKFEADHPELLVYTSDSTNLLAIEYAQPLSDTPPEGFPRRCGPLGALWGRVLDAARVGVEGQPRRPLQPTNSRVP